MPRSRRSPGSPVPPLHLVMIVSTVFLIVASGFAYFFAPPDKSAFFLAIATSMVGFLSGKLSNGFGKPLFPASEKGTNPDATDEEQ